MPIETIINQHPEKTAKNVRHPFGKMAGFKSEWRPAGPCGKLCPRVANRRERLGANSG
jgi:hypothetical protein